MRLLRAIGTASLVALFGVPGESAAQLSGFGRPPTACLDPHGEITPGIPFAVLCGLDGRLGEPVDPFFPSFVRTRPGFVHAQLALHLLRVARGFFPAEEFAELSALPLLDAGPLPVRNGLVRLIQAEIARNPSSVPALEAQYAALLAEWSASLNARFPRLLDARANRNRAQDVLAPDFLTKTTADTVSEAAVGMAEDWSPLNGVDRLSGAVPSDPEKIARIPVFIGRDGLRGTADDLPFVRCRPGTQPTPGLGGRCTGGASDAANEPLYYVLAESTPQACEASLLSANPVGGLGGWNQNGECIVLSSKGIVDAAGNLRVGSGFATLAAADLLADPAFRPAAAVLEPTDLTDLRLRAAGGGLAARPRSATGLRFPAPGAPFARRVDPETGAPVNATGPLECRIRMVGGLPAGPDGNPSTATDNAIGSVGNCLLFDDPTDSAPQVRRANAAIAASHFADQTLTAVLCTGSWNEDGGQCALDDLNSFEDFGAISSALGGGSLVTGFALDGYGSVRPAPANPDDPFDKVHRREAGDPVFGPLFGNLPRPDGSFTEVIFGTLTPARQALLGCGPEFLTPCDSFEASAMRVDPIFLATAAVAYPGQLRGGVDLQNGDATVVFQEFTAAKVANAGALVGDRDGVDPRFEAGILGASVIDPDEANAIGVTAWQVARDRLSHQLFGVPYDQLTTDVQRIQTATDFQMEPPRDVVDEAALFQRILLFEDRRGGDGFLGTADDVENPLGEDCTGAFGDPDPGCTPLEVISANLERLYVTTEILGRGRFFDPPETVEEIQNWLAGNHIAGDPVAGPDGIRFNDFDLDGDGRVTDGVNEQGDQKALIAAGGQLLGQSFIDCLRAQGITQFANRGVCYLNIDSTPLGPLQPTVPGSPLATTSSLNRLVAALPVALRLAYLEPGGAFIGNAFFRWQALSALEMQQFVTDDRLEVPASRLGAEARTILETRFNRALPETILLRPPGNAPPPGGVFTPFTTLSNALFHPQQGLNVDANDTSDLDEDSDRALDFGDDGTPGPVDGGNFFCGSGRPGDVLQLPAQHELDAEQRALLAAAFPDGFPPRSPVFCSSTQFLLGLTGESAPGRRDFLWHGAAPDPSEDADADGVSDLSDLCPTIADPDQDDLDGDSVGDLCDNCVNVTNPRIASPPPADLTTTGGQRDDNTNGSGNACDAAVLGGVLVTVADVNEFKASLARRRTARACGTSRALSCAMFDLDGTGLLIGVNDVNRARTRLGSVPGPHCEACGDFLRLPCEGPACPGP